MRQVLIFVMLMAAAGLGSTHTCSDIERSTWANATADAVDGDTIRLTTGDSAEWTEEISTNKGLHWVGTDSNTCMITTTNNNSVFNIIGTEGKQFTISNIRFVQYKNTNNNNGAINISGSCKTWRIHDCAFYNDLQHTDPSIDVIFISSAYELTYGLIDKCSFFNSRILGLYCLGDESWKTPLGLGDSSAIYIENCSFVDDTVNDGIYDDNCGGRVVIRYCSIVNSYFGGHSLQTGFPNGTFQRAHRKIEAYNNTFTSVNNATPMVSNFVAMRIRSGTGVIYNNTVNNSGGEPYNFITAFDNDRSYRGFGYPLDSCDGSSSLDGNTSPADSGWPCLDQIGRSTDHGAGSDRLPQESVPFYLWNNLYNGNTQDVYIMNGKRMPLHIIDGRDYFDNTESPDYIPLVYPHKLAVKINRVRLKF